MRADLRFHIRRIKDIKLRQSVRDRIAEDNGGSKLFLNAPAVFFPVSGLLLFKLTDLRLDLSHISFFFPPDIFKSCRRIHGPVHQFSHTADKQHPCQDNQDDDPAEDNIPFGFPC